MRLQRKGHCKRIYADVKVFAIVNALIVISDSRSQKLIASYRISSRRIAVKQRATAEVATYQGLPNATRESFPKHSSQILRTTRLAPPRERCSGGEARECRMRGHAERMYAARELSTSTRRPCVPLYRWHRAADVRDQGRGAPRRTAPRHTMLHG